MVGFGDWTMAAFVTGVVWALAYLGRASLPRWAAASMGLIWGSTVAAVFVADLTGPAITMAVWVTLLAGVFLTRLTMRAIWWTLPAGAIQAVALWYDQITLAEPHRQLGLMSNPNPAAGLMVLMSVLLLTNKRTQWLALPFLAAIPMTGSRAAVLVMAAMLGILLVKRAVQWRKWGAIVSIAALITMPFWGTMVVGLRLDKPATTMTTNAVARIAIKEKLSIIPNGPGANVASQHMQVLRLWREAGLVAALAWSALLVGALWKQRYTPAWYMLMAAAFLTAFDYYFWMPAGLTVLWWMLVKVQLQKKEA